MGKAAAFTAPRRVEIVDEQDRALGPREVRLRTLFSGISAGTELTAYRGTNPYIHKRWDAATKLFVPSDTPSQSYPLKAWGYEEVGEVVECGPEAEGVDPGAIVWGTWGHRTHHVVADEHARQRVLPAGLDPVLGIFSQIGAIALNGVHDAHIRVGETVAVFGLGVPGQIVAQLAKRSGATVVGVDLHPGRRALAERLGVDVTLDPGERAPAKAIKELTDGRGADVSIEVSGAYPALHEAIRTTAYSGRVVAMGFFQGEAQQLFLGEEFHHNRINVVCSQISGVDPELSYRWNGLRQAQTIMRLQAERLLDLQPLISHTYPFDQTAEAFRLLDEQPAQTLQVVLAFQ